MAKKSGELPHRGRLQAQGGGTQKDEAWAQDSPPTVTEILEKCDSLEAKLTPSERHETAFAELRRFVKRAAENGGVNAERGVFKKSFLDSPLSEIRVDFDVFKGNACVPDAPETKSEN